MAVNTKNISIPLSNIYVDVDVPAEGGFVTLTDGVPATGTHIGGTIGSASWEYSRDTIEFELEQFSGISEGGIVYNNESLTLTVPIAEVTAINLARAITGDTTTVDIDNDTTDDGTLITIGGKTEPESFSIMLVTEHRAGSGIFHYFMVYNVISAEGLSLEFSRSDAQTFEMNCRGLIVGSRPAGDQLGQIYIADIPEA